MIVFLMIDDGNINIWLNPDQGWVQGIWEVDSRRLAAGWQPFGRRGGQY